VLKEDVLRYLEKGPAAAPPPRAAPAPMAPPAPAAGTPAPVARATPPPATAPAAAAPVRRAVPLGEDKVVPIKGLQRTMVKTMIAAASVPVFGYADEVDVTELVATRARLKRAAEERGIKLSYLPFMMKAVSLALREYPMLNAHVNADCTEVVWKVASHLPLQPRTGTRAPARPPARTRTQALQLNHTHIAPLRSTSHARARTSSFVCPRVHTTPLAALL
jgi:2-oxoisovalerate dehydrogenase E2 component (dihydrolipoyl transacylase)